MAADKGYVKAMVEYASMQRFDQNIENDYKEAARYYKMAADEGNVDAMEHYALMVRDGEGVEEDLQEAANYLKAAIDKGYDNAFHLYKCLVLYRHFIDNDKETMLRLMKRVADEEDEDNGEFIFKCANIIYKRNNDIKPDLKEGAHYFKIAAMKDHSESKCIYNYMLYNGEGIKANKEEASQFFKNEVENDMLARYYYARCLLKSKKEADKKEAASYFKRNIDDGDSSSLYYGQKKAAAFFYYAMDVEENGKEAEKMYRHIVDNGEFNEEKDTLYIEELEKYLDYINNYACEEM